MVTGSRAEVTEGRVVRPDQHGLEAVGGHVAVILLLEQLELAHAFLIEADGALGSGDLEAQLHLVPLTQPAGVQGEQRAAVKGADGRKLVVGFDLLHLAGVHVGALVVHSLQARSHFTDRAAEPDRHGNLMAAHVTQRALAAPGLGQAPRVGHVHVAHEVLGVDAVEVHNIADDPVFDQLFDRQQGRGFHVVVAEDGLEAPGLARFGQRNHGFGICNRCRHGLLAPDVLAGGQRQFGGFEVGKVGGADRHHVDVVRFADFAPVLRRALKLIARAVEGEAALRHVEQRLHLDIEGQVEGRLHPLPGLGMGPAHKTHAEYAHAQALDAGLVFQVVRRRGDHEWPWSVTRWVRRWRGRWHPAPR